LLLTSVLLWIWIERRLDWLQMRRAVNDRYCLPKEPTAANLWHATAMVQDGTDGQKDRRLTVS